MDIGKRIKRARIIRRISQEELGLALKMTKQSVSLLEKGEIKPSDAQLKTIAETTKKPIEYFLNNDFKDEVQKPLSMGMKIRLARIEMKMSQKEFAKRLGFSQDPVSQYEIDKRYPSLKTLEKISKLTGKSLSYFITDHEAEAHKLIIPADNLKYIPIYGDVAAGAPVERLDQLQVDSYLPLPEEIAKGKIIKGAFRVASDSMEPRILKGSYVLIDNTKMVKDNDVALVHVRDKGACIKQICFMPNNKIKLIPHNKKYQVSAYKLDDVSILGKVIGNVNYSF